MRVLLIEDDKDFLEKVVPSFEEVAGAPANLTVTKSRDSAIAALNDAASKGGFFDIIVLDLSLPRTDSEGEDKIEHGMEVFRHALRWAPRTPVCILTSQSTELVVEDLLRHAEQINVWGHGPRIPSVQKWRKLMLPELLAELRAVACYVTETDEIEIFPPPGQSLPQLTLQQKRVLCVFARRWESRTCEVTPLKDGLSSSQVYRVTAKDDRGHIRIGAVGKIADIETMEEEVKCYNQHVLRLEVGAYPPRVNIVRGGAGPTGGVFYRLLDLGSQSLFARLADNPEWAATTMAKVRDLTTPWIAGEEATQVKDIRRRLVRDEKADELVMKHGLSRIKEGFESKRIQTRQACLHGDLHGGNILVAEDGTPFLIDFSEVGPGAASIDPITLELSLLFHPYFKHISRSWPSTDTAALWADLSRYTQGCPYPAFVQACRNWSHNVAAGNREIYASAYAYLLCQLKYSDTDKKLILVLLEAVWQAFDDTYK